MLRPSAKINLTLRVGPRRARRLSRRPDAAAVDRARRHADRHARAAGRSRSARAAPACRPTRRTWSGARRRRSGARSAATASRATRTSSSTSRFRSPRAWAAAAPTPRPRSSALNAMWDGAAVAARAGAVWRRRSAPTCRSSCRAAPRSASGRGDEIYPVDDAARLGVVIIKPSFGVATADAYRWLDEDRAARRPAQAAAESRDVDLGWAAGPDRRSSTICRRRWRGGIRPSPTSSTRCAKAGALGRGHDGQRIGGFRPVFRDPGAARGPAAPAARTGSSW